MPLTAGTRIGCFPRPDRVTRLLRRKTLTPQFALSFDGRCEVAFRCYEKALNATITFMLTWGDSPNAAEAPAGWETKIFHATLEIGHTVIMGGDALPGRYESPRGFDIVLHLNDPIEAERVFQALADGGAIKMPLQETFWASRFGALVDRFGIPWSINCERAREPES